MRRPFCCLLLICVATPAWAEDASAAPQWLIGTNGGTISRDGDKTRGYGSIALTRRLGRAYVRASVTRFGSAVRQGNVSLPSTYTLAFLSAGTTFGSWFVDAYGTVGWQHYLPIRTESGQRSVTGPSHSGVQGGGGDVGYVIWLNPRWSLTPSASGQYIGSKALREQLRISGPRDYETRETGATFGGTLRADHWFGPDRSDDIGIHVTKFVTTNRSAALVAGTHGGYAPATQSDQDADGWIELGGNAALLIRRNLYLDTAVTRTFGAAAGDVTTTSVGLRFLF